MYRLKKYLPGIIIVLSVLTVCGFTDELTTGVEHLQYHLDTPNDINVIRIDKRQAESRLKIGFPQGKRNFSEKATVSDILKTYHDAGERVVAAVNGSFFGEGSGISGFLASEGNYIQPSGSSWETLGILINGDCIIERSVTNDNGAITFPDNSSMTIDLLNQVRNPDTLVCYTPDWGKSTTTTAKGVEVVLTNVSYPMRPDKEVVGRVAEIRKGDNSTNTLIPEDGMVLSARDNAAKSLLSRVNRGQLLGIRWGITPNIYVNADLMITGAGWILHEGNPHSAMWAEFGNALGETRHPRTAIAWNDQYIFLVTCDGRQIGRSAGMTFQELADFLIFPLGATNAINLDGGGSTTMAMMKYGIPQVVNSPSDKALPGTNGKERPVANAILLVEEPQQPFILSDSFSGDGRLLRWDDKFTYNRTTSFKPVSPEGDGYVMRVWDEKGGYNAIRFGSVFARNYSVETHIYCEYRPDVASDGYERYALFVRDDGNANFDSPQLGGGNCYCLTFDTDDGRIRAAKVVDGTITDLLPDKKFMKSTAWHEFRIECVNNKIRYYIDDDLLLEAEDESFTRGCFGIAHHEYFGNNSNARGTRVDNFKARSLQ